MNNNINKEIAKVQNKLKTLICVYMCCGLLALAGFCFLLYESVGGVSVYTPKHLNYEQEMEFYVDRVEKLYNHISISGWAIVPEENIDIFRTHILLRNTYDGQYIKIPTIKQIRTDVTQKFYNPDLEVYYNYDMSGWYARVNVNRLSLPLKKYEIVILCQNNNLNRNILVHTGRHLDMENNQYE